MTHGKAPAWFPRHRLNKLVLKLYGLPHLSSLKEELAKTEIEIINASIHFDKLITNSLKTGTASGLDNIIAARTINMLPMRDRVEILKTEIVYERLRRENIYYEIDREDFAKFGEERKIYLTPQARERLEKRADDRRNGRWAFWDARLRISITLITALTGLLGTIIGILAFTGSKH